MDLDGASIQVDLASPLGKSLYRYGAPDEARHFARLVRPGDFVIDGGANVGIFALLAACAAGPAGMIVAVEAHPGTARILERNRRLSRIGWMSVVEKALGEEEGTASFVAFEAGSGLSRLATAHDDDGAERVATTTIDSIAASGGRAVSAIKLDIEGAEVLALRGGHRTLSKDQPVVFLEVEPAHLMRQGSDLAALDDLFARHGYSEFWGITDDGRVPLRALSDAPSRGVTNVLCRVPQSTRADG